MEGEGDHPISTWKLSKQSGRLLVRMNSRVQKMHALRHGFASWQLVRYFMIVEKQFSGYVKLGYFHSELDISHEWFDDIMLANFAEVIGGIQGKINYEGHGSCVSCATGMIMISKLLGHTNRFTTLENYTNTLGWIIYFFLRMREARLTGVNFPKDCSSKDLGI